MTSKAAFASAVQGDDQLFNVFLPIAKVDAEKRMVWGYASTPALDLDGEIVSLAAVKGALPEYMEWRNVREMHQPSAVGVTKEANIDEKGLYIGAHIRDDDAWSKCLPDKDGHAVYTGFSIGGRKLAKTGNTITQLELVEISIVDRPANPECRIDAVKAAKGAEPKPTTFTAVDSEGDDLPDFLKAGFDPAAEVTPAEAGVFRKVMAKLFGKVVSDQPAEPTDGEWLKAQFATAMKPEDFADIAMAASATVIGKFASDPAYGALLTLAKFEKRDFSQKERESAAESGAAMPDGSFLIKNEKDLKNAIQAHGRAKNPAKAKAHIVARAKELGHSDLLPDGWATKEKAANPEDLNKGMGSAGDLVYAFESIRRAQRSMIQEGATEKDPEDKALADRLGAIAKELADVIGDKAEHEGDEALDLSDADDRWIASLITGGVSDFAYSGAATMSKNLSPEEVKRIAAAHKASLMKAAHHLGKAMAEHAAGSACLNKAQGCFAEAKKVAGTDVEKAAATHAEALTHMAKAAGHFEKMGDHHDVASANLMKVAGAWGAGSGLPGSTGGDIKPNSQSEMTEGEVHEYVAGEEYEGKGAGMSQEMVDRLVAAEAGKAKAEGKLEGVNEMLQRMPGGDKRARVFAVDKTALAGSGSPDKAKDAAAALFEGVETPDQNDPDSIIRASGRMFGNMVAHPEIFAKSVFDPNFRGGAAKGRRAA